jgi:2'-5' RNA ligase
MDPRTYAVVAYIRNSVGEFIENLRRELHPPHPLWPAHITIIPPRQLQGSEAEAGAVLDRVCATVEPFEIVLGEVATFTPTTPTVFVRLAHGGYRLRELHDLLNIGPLRAEEQWPYMPHMTIVKMDDVGQALPAMKQARQRWEDFHGSRRVLIEQLTFVRQAGPEAWEDLAPVPLGRRFAPAL